MPRPNSVGKWNLKVDPNVYYKKEDPYKQENNLDEQNKADIINYLIEERYEPYNIIDIGCGEGIWTQQYGCFGADISIIAVARAKRRVSNRCFLVYDVTEKPLGDKYKTIILSEVLYYIKPALWPKVSQNIYDSLVPNGQFIISVGQYFTEHDIRTIFENKISFDKVYKMPNKKYGYWLIMSGHRV